MARCVLADLSPTRWGLARGAGAHRPGPLAVLCAGVPSWELWPVHACLCLCHVDPTPASEAGEPALWE